MRKEIVSFKCRETKQVYGYRETYCVYSCTCDTLDYAEMDKVCEWFRVMGYCVISTRTQKSGKRGFTYYLPDYSFYGGSLRGLDRPTLPSHAWLTQKINDPIHLTKEDYAQIATEKLEELGISILSMGSVNWSQGNPDADWEVLVNNRSDQGDTLCVGMRDGVVVYVDKFLGTETETIYGKVA